MFRIFTAKTWRIWFALGLIFGAYLLRRPWLGREVWNLDEGSTFTMAEQVLHGQVIYRDAADNRSPLVPYLKAAVFAVFGDWNAHAVHVVVAFMLGICGVWLWLLARRLGDEKTGIAGALFFFLLTFVLVGLPDSLSANTEWFVIFFSTLAFWLFARAQARPTFGRGVLIGLSFGLGTLCKQPGVLDLGVTFVLLGLLWFGEPAGRAARWRLLAGELTGFAATMAATIVYFAWNHALPDLVLYAWTFNTKYYVPEVPFWDRMWAVHIPFQLAFEDMPVALVAGVIGAGLLLVHAWRRLRRRPPQIPLLAWLTLGWTASGLLSTMISGRGFSHYSAQVIPGLSLACGWAVARLIELAARLRPTRRWAWAGLWALLGLATISSGFDVRRRTRGLSPNDDAGKNLGLIIQQFTSPQDHIFVWGYFPELYLFSRRLPSTRFIYTNYLTGMIAWTNLDMRIDTSYAIMPGAWRHFWEDWSRRPPALVVDTENIRGYLKYPLYRQTRLWQIITHQFAAVDDDAVKSSGVRFYRRLAPLTDVPPPADAPTSKDVTVMGTVTRHGGRLPLLSVYAPAGVTEVVVYQGDKPYRRLLYPAREPCQAEFFIDRDDLRPGDTAFRAAVRTAQGWRFSRTVDLASLRHPPPPPRPPGPLLHFGGEALRPIEGETLEGDFGSFEKNGRRWSAHAPSKFVYDCPPTMKRLTFSFGMDEASYQQPGDTGTNGADVVVSFQYPEGGTTQLYWRYLNPRSVGRDQGRQTAEVDIPPHPGGGHLIFQFLPGPQNDPAYDWTYWSDLGGQGYGPELIYGERHVQALSSETFGGRTMRADDDGRWHADSPAKVVYPYVPGMSALIFTYGLYASAYERPADRSTDGIDAIVEFEHPDQRIERLYFRYLDPRDRPADRGPQTARVNLPRDTGGHIIIRIGPGPHHNTAFDWAYLTNLRAQGSGPDIVWGGRILVPVESQTFTGPGMAADEHDIWRAHAPSRLVYDRPVGMTAISFGFGLDPNSYASPNPGDRTDGVEAVLEFQHRNGTVTTLFHRLLTPATNPVDRGTQDARVELPPDEPGRLIFLFTPGPRNSNAFDWSYWTHFIGAP